MRATRPGLGGYVCPARTRRAPGNQINVLAIYPNALPPNITPASSPGYLTAAVSGAHVWAEWLHHPCLLGGPQHGDNKWEKKGDNGENRGKCFPACYPLDATYRGSTPPPPCPSTPKGQWFSSGIAKSAYLHHVPHTISVYACQRVPKSLW